MTALMGAVATSAAILLLIEAIVLHVDGTSVTPATTTTASTVFTSTTTSNVSACGGFINGSGIVSSPNYPSFYPNNAVCRWSLTASPGMVLELRTSLLDLETSYDFLNINSTYSNKLSMAGTRYSGYVSNFSIILGERADVLFTSDGSVTKSGFAINVSSVSPGASNPTLFEDCGGNISWSGFITSPNYPNPYPNNANCRWVFRASSGSLVRISVISLNLESGYDNLTLTSNSSYSPSGIQVIDIRSIYDSPSRTLYLPTDEAVLTFQSDSTVQNQGFTIYVSSFDNSTNSVATTNSYITQVPLYNCGEFINGSGILSSPYYPDFYPNNVVCRWSLSASPGKVLELFTPLLDLESGYDFLRINTTYSNKLSMTGMRYSGFVANLSIILGERADISFTSDSSVTKSGFRVNVSSVSPNALGTAPFEDCGGNISWSAYVVSPSYPNPYPNNANCRWLFKASRGALVRVSVIFLDLEIGYDNLTITSTSSYPTGDTQVIDVRSIYETSSRSLTLPTDSVVLAFHSDSTASNQGFYLYFSSFSHSSDAPSTTPVTRTTPVTVYECGGNITDQGNFTSPGYPGLYPNLVTCVWYLKAAAGKVLQVDASIIDLENGFDVLTFNTTYPNKTVLESFRLTGYRTKVSLTLGPEAYAVFQSDFSVQRVGFVFFVSSITPPPGLGTFYKECNATIRAPGTLLSPNYPSPYPSVFDCQWTIQAPPGKVVLLLFLEFSITAPFDVLRIFREENVTCGTPFTTYTGSSVNGSVALGQTAAVAFSSGSMGSGGGFRLLVNFISAGSSAIPSVTATTAQPFTSCGSTMSGSGRLRSPNYPWRYPANTRCVWKLNRQAKWPCTLRINSLRLESPWDTVRVYLTGAPGVNDVPAAEYTGSVTGLTVSFNAPVLTVIFSSDESNQFAGFDINFFSSSSSPRPAALVKSVLPQPGECGVPVVAQLPTSGNERIVGGIAAQPRAWPWQAMLKYNDRFICGGSLIAAQWILTAGHCILSSNPRSFNVSLGKYYQNGIDATEQRFTAVKVIRHPEYDSISDDSDLALIKLPRPVTFSAAIKPICLPTTDAAPGSMCYISGWGNTEGTGNDTVLRQATIPIISRQCCSDFLGDAFTKNMSCAGYLKGGKDTCQGDSGGPMVCNVNGAFWLYGITSWGIGCGRPYYPGAYTRVPGFIKWITQTVAAN